MNLTKMEFGFLCLNVFIFGGLVVLIALRGPSVPAILLAVGAAGMAVAKIVKALGSKPGEPTRK
jgi:hypothetical protein